MTIWPDLACCKMPEPIIRFNDVTKIYPGSPPVLDHLSFTVERGEFLTVIGRSGCGKTTMLKMINGLLLPDSGTVEVEGVNVSGTDLIALRRSIGYVIQNVGLFYHMTVGKNIAYVPSLSRAWDKPTRTRRVAELLDIVGLPRNFADRYPSELSGGQRQRVGIARALALEPAIMLMDEPFGAVDEITRRSLQDELCRLQQTLKVTIIFITHDIREALKLGHRVMVMDAGQVVQLDTPDRICSDPKDHFVRLLLGLD